MATVDVKGLTAHQHN